jgi:7-carboxy-7-deazaguanine synthase
MSLDPAVRPAQESYVETIVATTDRLRITEIFLSVQGEARSAGWPTVFVRLTGCPLRCGYCDTAYAFHGGDWWEIDAILAEVARHGARHVCVTGGEPLAQKRCPVLLERLCDAGYEVSLETSGALDIGVADTRVSRVVDVKTPGSGEVARNRWENIPLLTPHDQVKFVICSRDDFEWARSVVAEHALDSRCDVLFSPSFGQVSPTDLAEWILADRLPVRFQLQLHKLLWGEEQGR